MNGLRRGLLIGLAALALAGCGRRGPLEPPPDASAPVVKPEADNPASPNAIGGPRKKKRVPINVPKDPFILDPIL